MKKTLFLLILSLFSITFVNAQEKQGKLAFEKGSSSLNLGVGLGSLWWGTGFTSSIGVNPTASYEYGITDQISIGGTVSYSSAKSDLGGGEGEATKFSATLIGARGSYHFATSEKFDPYVGIVLGYVVVSVSNSDIIVKGSTVGYGGHVGARYFFSPNIGVHAELGYSSLSFLTAGVSFKF